MKYLIASDIHGSAAWCRKLLRLFEKEGADKLVLLGDLLYHGPRNPFPDGYDTAAVYELLNGVKENILCVRGNCDSEVDQMVLSFPIMADSKTLTLGERTLFFTHGHLFTAENPPKELKEGDILFNGHFHVPTFKRLEGGVLFANCGSVGLPKDGSPHSCLVAEETVLTWKDLDTGNAFHTQRL
ncbi:MAG: phosphodiesterase [Clostridia bacterium]|nr:phosphodiesterase [Clostridia bacterium]